MERRLWLWLLWKYGKAQYFQAHEEKPTHSWLTNAVMLSTPGRGASGSHSTVPGGLWFIRFKPWAALVSEPTGGFFSVVPLSLF